MGKASEIVRCVDCRREFLRKSLNRNLRCPDCATKKVYNVVRQLHAKSGPEYEYWKEQTKIFIGRL